MGRNQAHTGAYADAKHQALFVLPVFCERQHSNARPPVAQPPFGFNGVIQCIRKTDLERTRGLSVAAACASLSGVAICEQFSSAFIL